MSFNPNSNFNVDSSSHHYFYPTSFTNYPPAPLSSAAPTSFTSHPPYGSVPVSVSVPSHSRSNSSVPVISTPVKERSFRSTASLSPSPIPSIYTPSTPSTPSSSSCSSHSHHLIPRPTGEIAAFTTALHEMLRTNAVRTSRQEHINEINNQLHAMNFFLNYCNATRTKQLQYEYELVRRDIENGRYLLTEMKSVIESQELTVNQLTSSVEYLGEGMEQTQQQVVALQSTVEEQKETLRHAMEEYEHRLAIQESQIRTQEEMLQRLLTVRFRMDFGIDMCIILIAWYTSHFRLLHITFRTLVNLLMPNIPLRKHIQHIHHGDLDIKSIERTYLLTRRYRHVRLVVQLIELITFLCIVRKLRSMAITNGIHNLVGTYTGYTSHAFSTAQTVMNVVQTRTSDAIAAASALRVTKSIQNEYEYEQQEQNTSNSDTSLFGSIITGVTNTASNVVSGISSWFTGSPSSTAVTLSNADTSLSTSSSVAPFHSIQPHHFRSPTPTPPPQHTYVTVEVDAGTVHTHDMNVHVVEEINVSVSPAPTSATAAAPIQSESQSQSQSHSPSIHTSPEVHTTLNTAQSSN